MTSSNSRGPTLDDTQWTQVQALVGTLDDQQLSWLSGFLAGIVQGRRGSAAAGAGAAAGSGTPAAAPAGGAAPAALPLTSGIAAPAGPQQDESPGPQQPPASVRAIRVYDSRTAARTGSWVV